LPSETRELDATALGKRVARLAPVDEDIDFAIAFDLARIFDALGCLQAVAVPKASGGTAEADPAN
jgi:hypothetical protein